MIKHIIKIIWAQRRLNGWIFGELAVVMCVVWLMSDKFWVDTRCYLAPMGYDIENTWRLRLGELAPGMPDYVADSTSNKITDLYLLMDRLRHEPEVEEACISFWSMPYAVGNYWRMLLPVGEDTTQMAAKSYHVLAVSPEYFDVFRIKDSEGRAIPPQLGGVLHPAVLTEEGEAFFFKGKSALGRQLSLDSDFLDLRTIVAVVPTFRTNDFQRPENCLFTLLDVEEVGRFEENYGIANVELSVRMRQSMSTDEMHAFLERAADRLSVGNIFVQGVRSVPEMRDTKLEFYMKEGKKKIAIVAFMLVNVFFGIVGTFWLRTGYRRGEVGLRMALGSTRSLLKRYLITEGLCLLLLTLPIVLVFIANVLYLDQLDNRLPYTLGRFLITFVGSYLLMGAMICLGVWLPARKSASMNPADALHYE